MAQEKAILAGGCFWGMQDLIRRYDGVISTRVGYSGGDVPNATYRNHGDHAEAIEIVFDPETISYRQLLEFFFQIHDPTTKNRQGNDLIEYNFVALFEEQVCMHSRARKTFETSTSVCCCLVRRATATALMCCSCRAKRTTTRRQSSGLGR